MLKNRRFFFWPRQTSWPQLRSTVGAIVPLWVKSHTPMPVPRSPSRRPGSTELGERAGVAALIQVDRHAEGRATRTRR
jgi:hypothetical protein